MKASLVITKYKSKISYFLFEDNRLAKAAPLYTDSIIGNIYTGKVASIVPNINAAFLNLGLSDYFYYSLNDNKGSEIFVSHGKSDKVCVGDELLVQVQKDPVKSKKGEVSSDLTYKGKFILLNCSAKVGISKKIEDHERREALKNMVSDYLKENSCDIDGQPVSFGAIIRTSSENAADEDILAELSEGIKLMQGIIRKGMNSVSGKLIYSEEDKLRSVVTEYMMKKSYEDFSVVTDEVDIYNELIAYMGDRASLYMVESPNLISVFKIEEKLEKAFNKYIYMKSGGTLVVEPTEALTVIDVNTAKAIAGKDKEKNFLKINKEAARTIARLLRLRNFSGIIIIDFINMADPAHEKELIDYLKQELMHDEIRVTYVDITSLGLVELTRMKVEKPLKLEDFS